MDKTSNRGEKTRVEDTLAILLPMRTERLRLAPLAAADAGSLQAITDDPAVISAISFLKAPFTLADAEGLISGKGDGRDVFMGLWDADGLLMGVVGSHLTGEAEIEIGYWLGTAFHGKGYASEAVRAVVSQLRQKFPARRIIAECRPENAASWHVLEKAGFQPTGEDGAREGRRRLAFTDRR